LSKEEFYYERYLVEQAYLTSEKDNQARLEYLELKKIGKSGDIRETKINIRKKLSTSGISDKIPNIPKQL
jgi:hypothetical protein